MQAALLFLVFLGLIQLGSAISSQELDLIHEADPLSLKCDVCKWAIKEVLDKVIVGKSCDEGTGLFFGECIALLAIADAEAACLLGAVAIKEICNHYGDKWVKEHTSTAVGLCCSKMHLC